MYNGTVQFANIQGTLLLCMYKGTVYIVDALMYLHGLVYIADAPTYSVHYSYKDV
jgi:hypothetical protein